MELTLDQAREIARLRRRHPGAEVVVHHRARDLIVEVRRGGRTLTLRRLSDDGAVAGPQALAPALAA
ncbi:MAG TPA: hypothetical protein VIL49_11255 [Capillimicrobium sp.]|jgi:hypothetical protein